MFNTPTVLLENRTGAPYGDALLAGVATGFIKDYSVTKEKAKYVDRLEPNQENHEKYMELFRIYRNLYQHIKQDYKDLKAFVNANLNLQDMEK